METASIIDVSVDHRKESRVANYPTFRGLCARWIFLPFRFRMDNQS